MNTYDASRSRPSFTFPSGNTAYISSRPPIASTKFSSVLRYPCVVQAAKLRLASCRAISPVAVVSDAGRHAVRAIRIARRAYPASGGYGRVDMLRSMKADHSQVSFVDVCENDLDFVLAEEIECRSVFPLLVSEANRVSTGYGRTSPSRTVRKYPP